MSFTRKDKDPEEPKASGCGKAVPWRGEKVIHVSDGKIDRRALAYLPMKYSPDKEYPLVMMFHGRAKQGRDIVNDTRFKQIADDEGFIVLAPDAQNQVSPWDGDQGPLISNFVDAIAAAACVDRTKVFAVGHEEGAAMARNLPCSMPVSAVAMTGHGIRVGERLCEPKTPVPAIRFHGTQDRYSPFKGGTGCRGDKYIAVSDTEARWRKRNGCSDKKPKTYHKQGKSKCYEWTCDQSFVSCHLDGGHDWPTAPPAPGETPSCVAKAPDYPLGEQVWEFFEKKGLALEGAE